MFWKHFEWNDFFISKNCMFWETFAPQKSISHQGSIISSLTRSPCERICAGSFLGFTFNASNSAGFCAAQSFRFEKGSRPNEWDEYLTQNCKTIKGAAKKTPKVTSVKKNIFQIPMQLLPIEIPAASVSCFTCWRMRRISSCSRSDWMEPNMLQRSQKPGFLTNDFRPWKNKLK